MEKIPTNWKLVEDIAKSVFPDDYAIATARLREHIKQRISDGLSPIEQDEEYGGMHCDFANAIEGFGMLMTILSMIVTWYTYTHPKPQKTDWGSFIDYLEDNPEELARYKKLIDSETSIRIKLNFTKITIIIQNNDNQ